MMGYKVKLAQKGYLFQVRGIVLRSSSGNGRNVTS